MTDERMTKDYESTDAGKSKGLRSATVSVRLDQKLRYFAELAARKQRRTLSSYIEWGIEESLEKIYLNASAGPSLADEASSLWDVDEADRFVKLAIRHQDLLTHEEQIRWKLIRENGAVWYGKYMFARNGEYVWDDTNLGAIKFQELRQHWDVFCKVAKFELGKEHLPTWQIFKEEGEIPF